MCSKNSEPGTTPDAAPLRRIRKALDGFAFAAFEAGAEGQQVLGDCAEVADWIECVMREVENASRCEPCGCPTPGACSAVAEIDRQRTVISKVNARCDHLGMRLGEIKRERDELLQRLRALVDRCAYDGVPGDSLKVWQAAHDLAMRAEQEQP